MPAEVLAYVESCETDKPFRVGAEQKALAAYVRRVFENENIYVDEAQAAKYLGLVKYFPYDDLLPWEKFLLILWNCTYRADGTPRWKTVFCFVGRGAGKDDAEYRDHGRGCPPAGPERGRGSLKKNMWEFKQSADPTVAELYIYGDVESDSTNFWTGEVQRSETSANAFRAALEKIPELAQINIYINSYGGSVFEGTAIYNQLRRHPAHKTVYVDGFACSIASVIAMAGDEVVMPRNTLMMIHNMWMGAVGNAAELRKAADDLDTINAAGRGAYLAKAGEKLTEEKLTELMEAETWLTAEQCIALGLADRYADADADMSGAAELLKKANLDAEQRLTMQKSLAAQLRSLMRPAADPVPPPKEPKPAGIMQMLAGIQ